MDRQRACAWPARAALLMAALSGCAQRTAPPIADDPDRQCWSTERLMVALGGLSYLTSPLDRSQGSVLATAPRSGDLLDVPIRYQEQRRRALRTCQRRNRVPVPVSELSFQMRAGALFAGSPAFNRIALLAVAPAAGDAPFGSVRADTPLQAIPPVAQQGPSGEQPYHFGGATRSLTVRCAPHYGELDLSSRRWSNCSAFLAVNDHTRLWVQFDASGRSPALFPRAIAAAQTFIQSTQR